MPEQATLRAVSVRGQLVDSRGNPYIGHHVLASFGSAMAFGEDDDSGFAPSDESEALWKPSEEKAEVGADGNFALELPDRSRIKNPIDIKVLAPDGQVLAAGRLTLQDLEKVITIKVDAKASLAITPSRDPFLGKRVKLTGRVLKTAGKGQLVNNQVVLWARPDSPDGSTFTPVLVSKTDAQGYFSADYPRGEYAEAYGVVGTHLNGKTPIQLVDRRFPKQVVLVADSIDALVTQKACACHAEVPRLPDAEDLTNSSGTYSADLGSGRCADFTKPNRSLEEFSFYNVVRTTEPQIKGLTLTEPPHLPPHVLHGLIEIVDHLHSPKAKALVPHTHASASAAHNNAGLEHHHPPSPVQRAIRPDILKALATHPDHLTPETLLNAEKATAFHRMNNVLEALKKPFAGRAALTATIPADWDDTPTFYQATTIAHGHLLHFKQVWKADGYSLGDLLYSLPLAPCQKKQIAVVDWDRREQASRAEQSGEQEELHATISRDRDIAEIVNSALNESTRGGSDSETSGFSAGGGLAQSGQGSVGFLSASVGGSFGMSGGSGSATSSAWQDSGRGIAATSGQHLLDTTMQSASAVRSQRATVVQSVHQGEGVRAQTEVVVNHNHCHAITMEYFEVLRHFLVEVKLEDVQECLFIPLLMSLFNEAKALRWREPLLRHLRNRELRGGFEAIERIANNYQGSNLPATSYADETVVTLDGELRISFSIARPPDPLKDGQNDPHIQEMWSNIGLVTGKGPDYYYQKIVKSALEFRDRVFEATVAPRIAEHLVQSLTFSAVDEDGNETKLKLDATLVSGFHEHTPLVVSLRMKGNLPALRRSQIESIKISNKVGQKHAKADVKSADGALLSVGDALPPNSKVIIQSGKMRYRTKHVNHTLFNDSNISNDLAGSDEVLVPTPLDNQELRNPREEDQELAVRLIAHLNEHIEYYHKAIWWRMDKERRFMLLDGFTAPNAQGRSVASVVENKLIGIAGNCLVMPVARGFHLDPTFQQDPAHPVELLHHYAPTSPIPPTRISVPTRGVFA